MKQLLMVLLMIITPLLGHTAQAADNLIILSLDGFRWQEMFSGVDDNLLNDERYTEHKETLQEAFSAPTAEERRSALMPFFWNTIAHDGVLIGDRTINSRMRVSNPWYFSYPGYNEMLTGKADPAINSNQKILNKNVTVLEWLNQQKGFENRVAAFGSWDVFPYIINAERSGVPVNAGFMPASGHKLTNKEKLLNELQPQTPSPWDTVRLDVFTFIYALEYLQQQKPRVLYISLGETDDFAHDGEYGQYLKAAHRSDDFIRQLWAFIQSDKQYRNNTNLLITSDHGRGKTTEDWQHHASALAVTTYMKDLESQFPLGVEGSETTWMAAIGPDIQPLGNFAPEDEVTLSQITATGLTTLGLDADDMNPQMAQEIKLILR